MKKRVWNVIDNLLGYNYKQISGNKSALLDLIRQIFKNNENEALTLDEIKENLESGRFLDLFVCYVFQENDNWKGQIQTCISTLNEIGYGIETKNKKYIYVSKNNSLTDTTKYPNFLHDDELVELSTCIHEGKNVLFIALSEKGLNILKECRNIITQSIKLNSYKRVWSKNLFDKIEKSNLFMDDKYILECMENNLKTINGKEYSYETVVEFYSGFDGKIIEKYEEDYIVTPYAITNKIILGGRLSKNNMKAYPIEIIPTNNLIALGKYTYQLQPKTPDSNTKVHHLPFSKIESRIISHYGESFKELSLKEKYAKIIDDKLWEYVRYHIKYLFYDKKQTIETELKSKFKCIKHSTDIKGYHSAYFNHNNEEEVFYFLKGFTNCTMSFTNLELNKRFKCYKKRISN